MKKPTPESTYPLATPIRTRQDNNASVRIVQTDSRDTMDLDARHAAHLDASSIAATIRAERGYRTVAGLNEWQALGWSVITRHLAHVGLAFPVCRLGAPQPYTWVLRPDNPHHRKGRAIKYEWPGGVSPCFNLLLRYRAVPGDPQHALAQDSVLVILSTCFRTFVL